MWGIAGWIAPPDRRLDLATLAGGCLLPPAALRQLIDERPATRQKHEKRRWPLLNLATRHRQYAQRQAA